jgi:flagellar basal-body rod protein FlgF
MIKGMYSAVSAMLAGVQRQKLLAHNAANLETPGFKEVLTTMDEFMQTPVEFPPNGDKLRQANYVGNLGLGVETLPEITNYREGAFESTGHSYDLAIAGPGFFRVKTPQGERLTRDGRFLKDAQGQLVTSDGNLVLNDNGQPIRLPEGDFKVGTDGTILVNNKAAGRLGLAAFQDPEKEVVRAENNTFTATGQTVSSAGVSIQQGFLEMSNVNASELMTQMVTVARAYEAAQKMVSAQDELLGKTISSLGRVS